MKKENDFFPLYRKKIQKQELKMVGKQIRNYRITKLLKDGSMSKVYLAGHVQLNRKATVHVFDSYLTKDEEFREQFRNHAALIAGLQHPNIANLIDYQEDEASLYLVSEFVEGISLAEYIRTCGAIEETKVIDIFDRVLSAFTYAHRRHVVHGAIKPANIMIMPDDTVKVLGFGITRLSEEATRKTALSEIQPDKMLYQSPEQLHGKAADPQSDVYALGVTLFEMLSGRYPYRIDAIPGSDIFSKIINEPLPPLNQFTPEISKKTQHLVDKATAKKPEERFQDADEFYEDFRQEDPEVLKANERLMAELMQEVVQKAEPEPLIKLPSIAEYTNKKTRKRRITTAVVALALGMSLYFSIPYMITGLDSLTSLLAEKEVAQLVLTRHTSKKETTKKPEKKITITDSAKVPTKPTEVKQAVATVTTTTPAKPVEVPEPPKKVKKDTVAEEVITDEQPEYAYESSGVESSAGNDTLEYEMYENEESENTTADSKSSTLTPLALDLRATINSYYQTMQEKKLSMILTYYSTPLERFFKEQNVSSLQLRKLIQQAWERTPEATYDILWETFKYKIDDDGNYIVDFWMNYKYRRAAREDWRQQRIYTQIKMNPEYKIIYKLGD